MKARQLICYLCIALLLAPCFSSGQNDYHMISSNVPLNEISSRACRQFYRLFPDAELGQYWYAGADGYQVSFTQKGVQYQAWFDTRGVYRYSLHYYAGKEIPREPGDQLKRKYPDYQINIVTEITDGEKIVYLARLVGSAGIKTVSLCDGELRIVGEQAISNTPDLTGFTSRRSAP